MRTSFTPPRSGMFGHCPKTCIFRRPARGFRMYSRPIVQQLEVEPCSRDQKKHELQQQQQQQSHVVKLLKGTTVSTCGLAILAGESKADFLESLQAVPALVQKDTVIGLAFGTAILALGAVTLGVLYLSLSSWNDKRIENAERASFEQALKDREARANDDKYRPLPKSKKKKDLVVQGEKKGFGR